MAIIQPDLSGISNGEIGDAIDWTKPMNTMIDDYNGNIDNTNIFTNANIAPSKINNSNHDIFFPGVIVAYGSSTAPTGWLSCDGSAVSRSTYANLFAIIGTTYGTGDGSTTFNLPDSRGRTYIGSGTSDPLTARSVGDTGGEENHAITEAELASHNHHLNPIGTTQNLVSNQYNGATTVTRQLLSTTLADTQSTGSSFVGNTGSGTAHNNMQPWICANYIIKT
jgi:microcystin-dependent protein